MTWNEALVKLGWIFYRDGCKSCGISKQYKRGKEIMTVYPTRNYYRFTQGGKLKTGKLSELHNLVPHG